MSGWIFSFFLLLVPQLLNQSAVVRALLKGVIRLLWLYLQWRDFDLFNIFKKPIQGSSRFVIASRIFIQTGILRAQWTRDLFAWKYILKVFNQSGEIIQDWFLFQRNSRKNNKEIWICWKLILTKCKRYWACYDISYLAHGLKGSIQFWDKDGGQSLAD